MLSYLADPGDPVLGALLRAARRLRWYGAGGRAASAGADAGLAAEAAAAPGPCPAAVAAAAARPAPLGGRGQAPTAGRLAEWGQQGIRLICPGDPEWPTQLAALGDASPLAFWLRGNADLRFACLRSVSVVGSRAATAYGSHVGTEMAAALAERGWAVVSGGAFGIDSAAHRGALAADGVTVAVLASGLSYGYPKGHAQLFDAIAAQGVLVSEMFAGPQADEAGVPGQEPGDRRPEPRHRGGRGGAAQRRAQHCRPGQRAAPSADGRARTGDIGHVGRLPRADQGIGTPSW